MDFSNWKTALFSAQGRMRRRDWWLWSIIIAIASQIVLQIVMAATGSMAAIMQNGQFPLPLIIAYIIILPINLWIGVCLTAKRWHDRDKSAWMYLIILIPIVGPIWMLVECGFLDGTQGSNKYGPSPKGIGATPDVF